eukprot:scaffold48588_cov42-Prasinocladus_malaysianus.AAC.1
MPAPDPATDDDESPMLPFTAAFHRDVSRRQDERLAKKPRKAPMNKKAKPSSAADELAILDDEDDLDVPQTFRHAGKKATARQPTRKTADDLSSSDEEDFHEAANLQLGKKTSSKHLLASESTAHEDAPCELMPSQPDKQSQATQRPTVATARQRAISTHTGASSRQPAASSKLPAAVGHVASSKQPAAGRRRFKPNIAAAAAARHGPARGAKTGRNYNDIQHMRD